MAFALFHHKWLQQTGLPVAVGVFTALLTTTCP